MDLSIVIVNWNTRELLRRCLQSLADSAANLGRCQVETIIVDNASTDGSSTMVRELFPQAHLIENEANVGFARANNQAITQSVGRYIVLLNSDTEVFPGALETMIQFMDEHPKAAGCGPRLLNEDGTLQVSCHPMLTPMREFWRLVFLDRLWRRATYAQEQWDVREPHPVEVIKGACLFLRRQALDQVGLLDDQYFFYTEEMDLCYRLLEARWELWWAPQAVVKHYGGASSRQAAEDMYIQLYRSKAQFHRKFGGPRRANHFKRLLALAYGPRWLAMRLASLLAPALAPRARTYRRLLRELQTM
ncbi:MAG: glycosyltransferase family 2 protein [Anaerolineales bacterium]|nr:glycosyltransferase family 2 protein [Anaerolineales bacterium]